MSCLLYFCVTYGLSQFIKVTSEIILMQSKQFNIGGMRFFSFFSRPNCNSANWSHLPVPPGANHFQWNIRRDYFLTSILHQHHPCSSEAADQIFIELFQVIDLGMESSTKNTRSNWNEEEVTDSNGKQTSISCSGEVSQGAVPNWSLEHLDDTSFHTWPSEARDTIYCMVSPWGSLSPYWRCSLSAWEHEPAALPCAAASRTAHPFARCCIDQAPSFCCEGPFAPCVSRYQTCQQPPLPLRYTNCGRPAEAVAQIKPTLFGNAALLWNRGRN